MTRTPPTQPAPVENELPQQQTMKILSILWYVYAGLNVLGICLGLVYVVVGVVVFSNEQAFADSDPNAPPPGLFGWLFTGMGAFAALIALLAAVLSFLCARRLNDRRGRVFCIVVSSLACLNVPLGTVLGVYTLITIMRDDVKASFT